MEEHKQADKEKIVSLQKIFSLQDDRRTQRHQDG